MAAKFVVNSFLSHNSINNFVDKIINLSQLCIPHKVRQKFSNNNIYYNDVQQPRFPLSPQNLLFLNALGTDESTSDHLLQPRREIHNTPYLLDPIKTEKSLSKIVYSIVPRVRHSIISDFLIRFYHEHEPITAALGMPISEVQGWFRQFIKMSMYASVEDVSVQAIDESGRRPRCVGILASIISDPTFASYPVLEDYVNPKKHPVNTIMNEFYALLEKDVNPSEAAGVKTGHPSKILEHLYMSVSPDYGGQGIGSAMLKLSESLAMNVINCRVGYAIATSQFSYNIFLHDGYKVVSELKYADYKNSKGEKIFAGKEKALGPHTASRAMVKQFKCLYGQS